MAFNNDECKESICHKKDQKWLKIDPDVKRNKYQSEIYSPFSPNAEINDWNLDFNDETTIPGKEDSGREELQLYSPFRTDDINEEEKQFKILDYRNRNYTGLSSSISVVYDYFFGKKKGKSKHEIKCDKNNTTFEESNFSEEEDIAF